MQNTAARILIGRSANSVTLTSWMGRYDAVMSTANLQSLAYEIDTDFRRSLLQRQTSLA